MSPELIAQGTGNPSRYVSHDNRVWQFTGTFNRDEKTSPVGTIAIVRAWQKHSVPLVSGQVFGAQAQEALNDCLLSETSAKHMMQQIALRHSSTAEHNSHRVEFQRPQQWVINKHGWFVTINLKDACSHITNAVEHRQFLHFQINVTHEVTLAPFGIASHPGCSRNERVVIESLQYQGLRGRPIWTTGCCVDSANSK